MGAGEIYREILIHASFFVPISIMIYLVYRIYKHAFKIKKGINEKDEQDDNGKFHLTEFFDDYYPSQRKIKYKAKPLEESGVHRKLNYQYVIERMTRKLLYTLILVVLFSLSFSYVLYYTSISERIAPDQTVMQQYGKMLEKIMEAEDALESKQIDPIIKLSDACHIDPDTRQLLITKIVEETIKNEDALILEVSKDFFNIYYVRYILVRVLIAFVIIGLIRFFINLYFRIQQERLDLIRKEEALSTMFYMLESKDGKVSEITGEIIKGSEKYHHLKIPTFPIKRLFEASYNKSKRSDENNNNVELDDVLDKFNVIINTQKEFYEGLLHKLDFDKKK